MSFRRAGVHLFVVALVLVGLVTTAVAPVAAQSTSAVQVQQAQPASDAQAAAQVAIELSLLEAARDFDALYDLMHPDSKAIAPREAVVGWFEEFFANQDTAELTVTTVEFVAWTWGVTGQTYPGTARVSFIQPYFENGVRRDEAGVVHLVQSEDEWRWFFGASREFVDEQIAKFVLGAAPDVFVSAFTNPLDADIDEFWFRAFADAGLDYTPPTGIVAFDGPIVTECGPAEPESHPAFYCTLNQTIYYDVEFRAFIEARVGEFAWVSVVAHEWGHHIQTEVGLFATVEPELYGGVYAIELELQADCLAGAYTGDADARGWLDPGDVRQALILKEAAGDPTGTSWDDPKAHGTSEQRVSAFLTGYQDGLVGCDLDLAA